MGENKGILLRAEHVNGLKMLDMRQIGVLVMALFADAGTGDMPDMDGMTRVVFELIAPSVRRANDAYASRCEANARNGRKGGRPRKDTPVALGGDTGEKAMALPEESENLSEALLSENEAKEKKRGFTPPAAEEVQAYCEERGNGIEGRRFCDYYAAQGWKLSNGRVLKDWKAAVRNWESREKSMTGAREKMSETARRQAHNEAVCRQVAAELEARGGVF